MRPGSRRLGRCVAVAQILSFLRLGRARGCRMRRTLPGVGVVVRSCETANAGATPVILRAVEALQCAVRAVDALLATAWRRTRCDACVWPRGARSCKPSPVLHTRLFSVSQARRACISAGGYACAVVFTPPPRRACGAPYIAVQTKLARQDLLRSGSRCSWLVRGRS